MAGPRLIGATDTAPSIWARVEDPSPKRSESHRFGFGRTGRRETGASGSACSGGKQRPGFGMSNDAHDRRFDFFEEPASQTVLGGFIELDRILEFPLGG